MIREMIFFSTTPTPTCGLVTKLNVVYWSSFLVSGRVREVAEKGHYKVSVEKVAEEHINK